MSKRSRSVGVMQRIGRLVPLRILVAVLFIVAGIFALQASSADEAGPNVQIGQTQDIIVQYKEAGDVPALPAALEGLILNSSDSLSKLNFRIMTVANDKADYVVEQLRRETAVISVEKDRPMRLDTLDGGDASSAEKSAGLSVVIANAAPNDPLYPQQYAWPLTQTEKYWDMTKGSSTVVIAVISSGADRSHPDLLGQTVAGYDFVNDDSAPDDDHGQGTAVAGIIGAKADNGIGVAGGCSGCRLMPVKFTDVNNNGTNAHFAEAVSYAVDKGAKIITMPASSEFDVAVVKGAIDYAQSKGVIVFASAGLGPNSLARYPAAYPSVVSVAASMPDDTLTATSNYGPTVDIAAPGSVLQTTKYPNKDYGGYGGTAASAAVVASIAGLLYSSFPQASLADMKAALLTTADTCCGNMFPGGRVNAMKAYQYLLAKYPPPDTTKPTVSFGAPADGAVVNGKAVAVEAIASDNVAVAKVEMQVNAAPVVVKATAPYTFTWDSTTLADGPHVIKLTAYDSAGNTASVSRTVTVRNATVNQADLNADGKVNISDLSILLSNWGKSGVPADLNQSGKVDITDLSIMISRWT